MNTRRFIPFALLFLVPAPAASADGCPAPCSGQSSSPPSAKLLYVQPRGVGGPVVAYDTETGKRRFRLPAGISSADGRWHVVATDYGAATMLTRFALQTGQLAGGWSLRGSWEVAGVSPSGRWAAAVARRRSPLTRIAVVDIGGAGAVRRVSLRGDFEVETLSADGTRLFLIEHLGATRYLVRLYDLRRRALRPGALRDARNSDKLMTGYAWSGIASPDGRWLLTLYLNTSRRNAFVHALDLNRSAPACVDLPSGLGRLERLKRYTLTLSPNGQTLFAANTALGVVAEVDLRTLRIARKARFTPSAAGTPSRAALLSGTISRNGRTLYFSGGSDLWAYDAAAHRVRGPYRTGGRVVGFGFGSGDRLVHAVRADGRMISFDAATGKRVT